MIDEKEVWERITATEQSLISVHQRLDNIGKLTESVYTLASETKQMRTELNGIVERVDSIEEKPARRYELIITTIITAITSAGVGFIISNLIR